MRNNDTFCNAKTVYNCPLSTPIKYFPSEHFRRRCLPGILIFPPITPSPGKLPVAFDSLSRNADKKKKKKEKTKPVPEQREPGWVSF